MRKLKMFGFAFMAMFVGIMSTYAFTLTSKDGIVTATVEANERFAYEVIKIEESDWTEENKTALDGYISSYNTASSQLTTYANEYPNDMTAYDTALEAYKASATDENKEALDAARAKLQTCVDKIDEAKAAMKTAVANMGSILKFDEFNPDNLKTIAGGSSEQILSEEENLTNNVYVVYVKNDCFSAFNSYGVMPFAVYQNGDNLTDELNPEDIPELREDFPMPEEETTEPEGSQTTTNTTTDKKDDVKNPKTGVSMPVALGFGVVALAGAVMFVVCKKQLFKQL